MQPNLVTISIHAQDRLRERYGIEASDREWTDVVEAIRRRRALLLNERREGSQIWVVTVRSIMMKVVYSAVDRCIVTVMDFDNPRMN